DIATKVKLTTIPNVNNALIVGIPESEGRFLMVFDLTKEFSNSANQSVIQAAAEWLVFAIPCGVALNAYTPDEVELSRIHVVTESLTALYHEQEARLSSQANEEALARGENIFGDDEIAPQVN
ncbi:hypothetical protein, partial [Herbiconiux daphne]